MLLLKSLHIATVALWFAGLALLPQLLAARARVGGDDEDAHFIPLTRRLYFHLMTPAAVLGVALGIVLIALGQPGAWLAAKLALIALAALLHAYLGLALYDASNGRNRHRPAVFHGLSWCSGALALAILALTATKPLTLAPFDANTARVTQTLPPEPDISDRKVG